jgi:16S rRNA (guanine527-N7)-methyltransferase
MDRLHAVLERSRTLGLLGPGPVEGHRAHARGFVTAWETLRGAAPTKVCDLGAGGGVPGLVLAFEWTSAAIVLLESSARRCRFLREAIVELGLDDRAEVAEGRAELLARTPSLEGQFALVTSRSFGAPATTAECSVRLLAPEALLIVAEPPSDDAEPPTPVRWPEDRVAELGLRVVGATSEPSLVLLERVSACPPRYPRRDGVPAKNPLF